MVMGVIWCNPGKGPINMTQVFQGSSHSLEAHSVTVSYRMSWPYYRTVPHSSSTVF